MGSCFEGLAPRSRSRGGMSWSMVVIALCAEMLLAGGVESDRDTAKRRCDDAVASGRAAEIFGQMCAALGGPGDFVEN